MARIEECNLFVPPLFTVFAAQVFCTVFFERIQQDLFFYIYHFFHAFISYVHESTRSLHTDNLFDQRSSLCRVVQTHNRGLKLLQQFSGSLECTVHILEKEAAESSLLRLVENADLRLGDNTEGSLRTDKDLVQVGTGCMLGCRRGVDDITVGKYYFHLQYHVIDLTVLGRHYTDSSVCQESSHGRTCQRRRIMHGSLAYFVGSPFDMLINRTGAALYVHTFCIYFINLIHSLGVQNNTAAYGDRAALGTAATAPGGNGNLVVICNLQYLGGFLCILRSYYNVCLRHSASSVGPHTGQPVVIYAVGYFINLLNGTIFHAYCIFQLGEDHCI